MSLQGIVLIDIVGLILILLIVNLLRTQKLHVGYAILWLVATLGLMATVSVPALLALVTRLVGAIFPASALSLLAFVFIFVVLIFYSVKLSALSSRQTELIQSLAIRDLLAREARSDAEAGPTAKGGPATEPSRETDPA